jgi:UDPglucose 6-dehydrogenase
MDLKATKELMKGNVFVDLRNVYEPAPMAELGFHYTCVGRPGKT